jgi:hypothetical protein
LERWSGLQERDLSERADHSTDSAGAATLSPMAAPDPDRAYREQMAHVLYQLRLAFPRLGGDDRLEIYDEVWTRLLERRREGFWPDDLRGWLVGAVLNQARAEHRKRCGRRTDPSDPFVGGMTLVCDQEMDEVVLGALDAENYRAIIASLSCTGRLFVVSELDAHQGTLRALRLPEQPPSVRRSLGGRGAAAFSAEQVPSLLPEAFIKRSGSPS